MLQKLDLTIENTQKCDLIKQIIYKQVHTYTCNAI